MSYRRHLPVVALLCAAVLGTAAPNTWAVSPSPRASSAADPATPTATNKPRPVASASASAPTRSPSTVVSPPAVSSPSATSSPSSSSSPSPGTAAGHEAQEAAKYWTAQRMANARPLDALRSAPSTHKHAMPAAGNASQNGTLFGGTRLVGTFFGSSSPTGTNWSCTGSVIDTPTRNVILTAAHCGLGYSNNYIFVPKFIKGAGPDQQPYGIFHIQHVFIDPRYIPDTGHSSTKKPWSDLDTAFARVSANQRGRQLQDAVGEG